MNLAFVRTRLRRGVPARVLLPALGGLLALADARPAPLASIALHEQVQAGGAHMVLRDIAEVSAADPALAARLRELNLGAEPPAGTSQVVTRQELARWIRARTGLLEAELEWRGSARVSIRSEGTAGIPPDLERAAREALRAGLQRFSVNPEMTVSAQDAVPELPAGRLEYRARALPAGTAPAGHMEVWVDVWQDGRPLRAVRVDFRVTAPGPAWVARQALEAGARPAPQAFELRDIDLAHVRHPLDLVGDPDRPFAAGQIRLRKHLAAGEALGADSAEALPAVSRGESVRMVLHEGAVLLETRARALQDGCLGQLVAVQPGAVRTSIQARVTGAGTVEVQ